MEILLVNDERPRFRGRCTKFLDISQLGSTEGGKKNAESTNKSAAAVAGADAVSTVYSRNERDKLQYKSGNVRNVLCDGVADERDLRDVRMDTTSYKTLREFFHPSEGVGDDGDGSGAVALANFRPSGNSGALQKHVEAGKSTYVFVNHLLREQAACMGPDLMAKHSYLLVTIAFSP